MAQRGRIADLKRITQDALGADFASAPVAGTRRTISMRYAHADEKRDWFG